MSSGPPPDDEEESPTQPLPGRVPPGFGSKWKRLRGGQGWLDPKGHIWKLDRLHKDHWDVSLKGKKVREIDFAGNQIWPDGPKNRSKMP